MIITCSECSTRFNLDDSLVKATGSKVRCSVCKNIFTAYPLSGKPEQADAEDSGFMSEETPSLEDTSDFDMGDGDLSLNDSDLEIDHQDLVLEDSEFTSQDLEQKDTDFSFEEDFELNMGDEEKAPEEKDFEFEVEEISNDAPVDADENKDNEFDGLEFEPMKDESDELTLSMEEDADLKDEKAEEPEEEFELEFDVDEDLADTLSDAPDPDTEKSPSEAMKDTEDEEALSLDNPEPDKDLDEITPRDDFSEYDAVLEQETEPEDNSGEDETDETENIEKKSAEERPLIEKSAPLMDLPERSSRRKKKPLISLPVLMLLLIFLVAVGAYVASLMTGYKIPYLPEVNLPFIEKYLKKPAPAAMDVKPVPNDNSVNGRFVSNTRSGPLFVITGRVENTSGISFSHIAVQGTLSTKENPVAKTKNAFCGNIIPEEMLTSGDVSEIMKLLDVKEGSNNSNVNIKPGAGIPFMIVFSDLPEKLQNYYVKVVGFNKAPAN